MIEWRKLPDHGDYMVSSTGQVRGVYGKILKGQMTDGSRTVAIKKRDGSGFRRITVAKAVISAWTGLPASAILQSCHLDGNGDNNRPENLMFTRVGRPREWESLPTIEV